MPYLPKSQPVPEPEPEPVAAPDEVAPSKRGISTPRKSIWMIGIGVGLYLIISGIWQAFF